MASILQKLFGRRDAAQTGSAPAAYVGAFGKHPAWNDFVDDIGLETQRLIDAKRLLLAGVDVNIAQWDHLHEQQRLDEFRHVFLWVGEGSVLVGRLWASSDGKGRTRYPMVAVAECAGLSLAPALRQSLQALDQVERRVAAATTQQEVVAAADAARQAMRQWAASAPPAPGAAPAEDLSPATAAGTLLRHPDLGPAGRGIVTLLYRLEQEAPHWLTWGRDGKADRDSKSGSPRPAYVRLPACADNPGDAMLLWARFLANVASRRAPLLFVAPSGERWVDLVVGEPTPASLYCLRANEKGVPLTTDIPYSIEPAFAQKAAQFVVSAAAAGSAATV